MISLEAISSGSKGNCYLLQINGSYILLEGGVSLQKIRQFLFDRNLTLNDLLFCFVSHEHKDHAQSIKALLDLGAIILASFGTIQTFNLPWSPWNLITVKPFEAKEHKQVGIVFKPFPLIHDAIESLGLVIDSPATSERFVYITDTAYVPYRFKGITHLAVECNYIEDLLLQSDLHPEVRKRIIKTHLGLRGLLLFLERNKPFMPNLQKVWVLHLSDKHTNQETIYNEIRKVLGNKVPIIVC